VGATADGGLPRRSRSSSPTTRCIGPTSWAGGAPAPPSVPSRLPVRLRPDGVCEIVSPSRPSDDTVKKLRGYQRAAMPHYWLLDLRDRTLTVLRLSADGYVVALKAEHTERVRAEPFDGIEVSVAELFGADA